MKNALLERAVISHVCGFLQVRVAGAAQWSPGSSLLVQPSFCQAAHSPFCHVAHSPNFSQDPLPPFPRLFLLLSPSHLSAVHKFNLMSVLSTAMYSSLTIFYEISQNFCFQPRLWISSFSMLIYWHCTEKRLKWGTCLLEISDDWLQKKVNSNKYVRILPEGTCYMTPGKSMLTFSCNLTSACNWNLYTTIIIFFIRCQFRNRGNSLEKKIFWKGLKMSLRRQR